MMSYLIENFNTTNQRIPQALPHDKLVVDIFENNCAMVQNLEYQDRCHHVSSQEDCNEHSNVAHIFSVLILVLIMCFMFLVLAEITDKFFCPALTALAKWLKMNENLAGLTLLAFGNGAPDVFSSIVTDPSNVGLVFSETFGASCLISGLIVGIIALIRPYKVFAPTFLRDILFFILGIFFIDVFTYDGRITTIECSVLILIYILFIICVLIDQFLVERAVKEIDQSLQANEELSTKSLVMSVLSSTGEDRTIEIRSRKNLFITIDILQTIRARFTSSSRNKYIFKQFFQSIRPIEKSEWENNNFLQKIIVILKFPISVALTFIIPAVDFEKDLHGWSKFLNSLQIIIIPQVILCLIYANSNPFIYTNLYPLYALCISIPLALVVFLTSRTNSAPIYHWVFCLITIGTSIFFISVIAGEVVMVLYTIGVASSRSQSFLGITLLGLGNSIADLLANPALAKQGYSKMALAACYGGPMFNILIGLSIIFLRKINKDGDPARVQHGLLGPNAVIFLQITLLMTVFALLCTNFNFRRSIGVFLLSVFLLHMLYAWLGEFEVIHPFGTNHQN